MANRNEKIDNDILDSPVETKLADTRNGTNSILNDSSIFYKGLFGMILCIVPTAIIGLVLIKISLEQASEAIKEYKEKPGFYKLNSFQMVKKGRRFAYIGLFLFIAELTALVGYMSLN